MRSFIDIQQCGTRVGFRENAEVSITVLQVGDGENISNLNLFLGFSGFGVDCPDPIVLLK